MPQFCILFYANYTILATQRGGGHGPMPPLNTPLITPQVAPVERRWVLGVKTVYFYDPLSMWLPNSTTKKGDSLICNSKCNFADRIYVLLLCMI